MKKALVIRYGAFGDTVMASPLFRLLKRDGYHTTANVNPRTALILRHNPYIDEYIIHQDDSVPMDKLEGHWAELSKGFDRVINLSGSIEGGLLRMEGDIVYKMTHANRHIICNENYYDKTLEIAGFPDRGLNGELYFDGDEVAWAQKIMSRNRGKFVILWSLSGSSPHKVYPYAEVVANEFLERHKDAVIYTVGDGLCQMLEFLDLEKVGRLSPKDQTMPYSELIQKCSHPRVKRRASLWSIRHSFVMTKYVDCVVGTETGVLNASGCFDTPKIVMLSHSSHENLSKYWKNAYPVEAMNSEAPCHPCHKMIYRLDQCMVNSSIDFSICMAHLKPQKLMDALESVYSKWRIRNGTLCI